MVGSVLVVELRFSWDILVFMNLKIIYKDKGKRELRNLQSSVNYDGR